MLEQTNELVLSCEKLVLSIVNKYGSNYNKEDLYQVGIDKLSEITPKYDSNLGVKFSTYVYKHVLGAILKYIREDKNIHISRDVIALSRKIQIAEEQFYKSFGRNPNTLELSKILSEEESKIIQVLSVNQNTESLEQTFEYDDGSVTLGDKVYVEDKVDNIDLISLKYAFKELDDDKKSLIYQRYFEDKTQTEIAKEMNISQVKVYRMERKILDELKEKMEVV